MILNNNNNNNEAKNTYHITCEKFIQALCVTTLTKALTSTCAYKKRVLTNPTLYCFCTRTWYTDL